MLTADGQTDRRTSSIYRPELLCNPAKNGRTSKLFKNCTIRSIIDDRLKKNDEETAKSLQVYLQHRNFQLSISTINRIKQSLGWTLRGTRYCQLIREANKPKRVQWANDHIGDSFEDVIWTDETSVWLEQHATRCYRRRGVLPKRKPKPKYPLKVHVWAGISKKGKTEVCIFKGIMDAKLYVKIIGETLLPFIRNKYPRRHRFMQDNDPKHKSLLARRFFETNNINWWKTPADYSSVIQVVTSKAKWKLMGTKGPAALARALANVILTTEELQSASLTGKRDPRGKKRKVQESKLELIKGFHGAVATCGAFNQEMLTLPGHLVSLRNVVQSGVRNRSDLALPSQL
ncbi:hypothetical protein FSP39_022081 [Pinctada imbricata]|uniref:Transposase Tc1-like domain-containing protein n=1 Tax=Pinctada imbricata TaxID=66713 RepID=A0AA88Y926_PINIB|nr:hypothetical protein FSP39_022081 [Pinctada imbricata]